MTVDEAAQARGYKIYDTALPQPWVDKMRAEGIEAVGNYVWCYDILRYMGGPAPVSAYGDMNLETAYKVAGLDYERSAPIIGI